jgi:hypothetical protein
VTGRATERGPFDLPWPGLLGLGVFLLTLWAQTGALVGVFYDDGIYITGAKALAEGQGYRNIHLPGAPPMVHYPVLYPAMLSLLWRLWPAFPANVTLFALADAAALGAAAWIMAVHGRRIPVPAPGRYLALALGFMAFPLLALVGVRFAEPLFLALVAGAVALADRESADPKPFLAAGALAGLAALSRTIGICAVAAIPLALWLRGRRRSALLALAAAVVVLTPWVIWVALRAGDIDPRLTNYTAYGQVVGQTGPGPLLQGLLTLRALWPLPELVLPRMEPWGFWPLAVAIMGLTAWGAGGSLSRAPALVATLACYLLISTIWPFTPHRFVWIIVPWLGLWLAVGLLALWRLGRAARSAAVALTLVMAAGYLPRQALSLGERRFARPAQRMSQSLGVLAASASAELPADAVIASEDEALLYLYAGRRSVPSHLFRWQGIGTAPLSPEETIRYWCDAGVTHLALTGPGGPVGAIAAELAQRSDTVVTPLFRITNGPGLYRFRCPG